MTTNLSNGLSFLPLARLNVPCETTLAFGSRRIIIKGTVAIDWQKGSTVYGPQLQIHVFTKSFPSFKERRENKKYTRLEIAMPVQAGFDFLNMAVNQFRIEKAKRGIKVASDNGLPLPDKNFKHHAQPFGHGQYTQDLRT